MSHELRTPLNAVIGFAELMRKETLESGSITHQQYCDYIISGGQHLLSIISDVLDMAQIEAGKMQLKEKPAALTALLEDTLRLVQRTADEKGVRLVFDAAVQPTMMIDEAKLRQVLVNIIDNALKFSNPGGTVRLDSSFGENGGVCISISDTGIGMKSADMEIAFSRFGRIGSALLTQPGTGLGLPLSVDLMRLHGGDLVLDSEHGTGTRVRLLLPAERVVGEPGVDKTYAIVSS
jgi:signal transduction histidine kinase